MRKYLIFARTEREANEDATRTLEPVEWAEPLLKKIASSGGLNAPSGLLFELRFAADLQRAGGTATYEFKTGVGESSVDFLIHSSPEWLVELASAEPNRKPGEADQQLKFAGVLSDKVCDESGAPQKFPLPTNKYHLIVFDVRAYLYGMGEIRDWREIAYGPAGLRDTDSWARHFAETGPIRGPFDAKSPVPSAATFRERIHFIGFVNEKCYCPGEFRWREAAYYLPNPHLFTSNEKAAEAFRSYPLQLID